MFLFFAETSGMCLLRAVKIKTELKFICMLFTKHQKIYFITFNIFAVWRQVFEAHNFLRLIYSNISWKQFSRINN